MSTKQISFKSYLISFVNQNFSALLENPTIVQLRYFFSINPEINPSKSVLIIIGLFLICSINDRYPLTDLVDW